MSSRPCRYLLGSKTETTDFTHFTSWMLKWKDKRYMKIRFNMKSFIANYVNSGDDSRIVRVLHRKKVKRWIGAFSLCFNGFDFSFYWNHFAFIRFRILFKRKMSSLKHNDALFSFTFYTNINYQIIHFTSNRFSIHHQADGQQPRT